MPKWESILASAIVLFAFIAIALIIIQIVNTLNMKKKKDYFRELHLALKPGVQVILASGLYGKLTVVKDDYVRVEISKGIEIKSSRYSISEIIK